MLHITSSKSSSIARSFAQRVTDVIPSHARERVWARASGPHVLLGLDDSDAFARVTPLGGSQYGLAFRALEAQSSHTNAWEPLFLVDTLGAVVEHALVAVDAIAIGA